jgi:hypothetical protein
MKTNLTTLAILSLLSASVLACTDGTPYTQDDPPIDQGTVGTCSQICRTGGSVFCPSLEKGTPGPIQDFYNELGELYLTETYSYTPHNPFTILGFACETCPKPTKSKNPVKVTGTCKPNNTEALDHVGACGACNNNGGII